MVLQIIVFGKDKNFSSPILEGAIQFTREKLHLISGYYLQINSQIEMQN